ncbi:hypothetical protein D3C80_1607670 [compost metagenome]
MAKPRIDRDLDPRVYRPVFLVTVPGLVSQNCRDIHDCGGDAAFVGASGLQRCRPLAGGGGQKILTSSRACRYHRSKRRHTVTTGDGDAYPFRYRRNGSDFCRRGHAGVRLARGTQLATEIDGYRNPI